MDLSVGAELDLFIERLSYDGGRGVARHERFVVFVPKTAPNETVRARITQLKKNYAEAELLEILSASPHRREPPCPYSHRCGGCTWQHVQYPSQLEQKRGLIAHALRKWWPNGMPIEVTPSPEEFRYRDRVQIHADIATEAFGFFEAGSNQLVAIEDCLISDARLFHDLKPALQKKLRSLPALGPQKKFRKVELVLQDDKTRRLVDLESEEPAFRQVNPAQNLNLVEAVVAQLSLDGQPPAQILDLYCGDGNFSFPLAQAFPKTPILGVEFSASAVHRAQEKCRELRLPNIRFFASDTAQHIRKLPRTPQTAVLVDPPRAGLDKATAQELLRLAPDKIVYVSCSLSTLARDLSTLCEHQYEVSSVRGFDMFPQTEHIETLTTLLPRAT